MERALRDIVAALRETAGALEPAEVERLIRARNRAATREAKAAGEPAPARVTKKQLLPFYLDAKAHDPARWASWGIDAALEQRLVRTLQLKPRRTASGVATVTVLTKPWPCASACLYCPNDVRMPKSYLADEPACQRAERVWFDPYLQVHARLRTLAQMGHVVDKVELIVLGGTWSDYPRSYQLWFARELFRALNEFGDEATAERSVRERRARYEHAGLPSERAVLATAVRNVQQAVNTGELTYNRAVSALYGCGSVHATNNDTGASLADAWRAVSRFQTADLPTLEHEHRTNETAAHRCVGLVVETRPDAVSPEGLVLMRRIGCTKVQMGLQSLDDRILQANHRGIPTARIREAFALTRLFGFKIHAHFMANLYGATPDADKRDYRRLVEGPAYQPDEVKLYPCALVAGTGLCALYDAGAWQPYTEAELIDVLAADVAATPSYVRISRMIRDISAHDILVGNKKVNLRQLVDERLAADGVRAQEIRAREIATHDADLGTLSLEVVPYETDSARERFLQWVTDDGRIAGFLRLSLPHPDAVRAYEADALPINEGEAMIREVHVYGRATSIGDAGAGAQHHGLGRALVERACAVAQDAGYTRINVISAVGTRGYYRKLGFTDNGLYQQRAL